MTLDEIRAQIVDRIASAEERVGLAVSERDCAEAELEAHDRAVAAMPALANGAAKPERAARRDLALLVRDALTDEPQTLAQIAEKTGVPPSRVLLALKRLGVNPDASQRWSVS